MRARQTKPAPEATILLCAGPMNYSDMSVNTTQSNAMVPVNGKPVVGWLLDDLLAKRIGQVTVVLRDQDQRLKSFLAKAYKGRMRIVLVPLKQEGSILQSLQAGLSCSATNGLVRIVLGDTLIRDSYERDEDFVYTGHVNDSRRWCLVSADANGKAVEYEDKQDVGHGHHQALAGYYHLLHGDHLRVCVERSIMAGEHEISDVLRRYAKTYPIRVQPAADWYDFGHIDNLVDARRRLLASRSFNALTVDALFNTVTKTSEHNEKLHDELNWYLSLPDPLKALTPRIFSHQEVQGHLQVVEEYYGYPSLAELYVFGDLHRDTWISILRKALRIHREFLRFPGTLEPDAVKSMYVDKTRQRLDAARKQDPFWSSLFGQEQLVFNGRALRNLEQLEGPLQERAGALARSARICVIHGDFCFSNILFDVSHQIIRLIDPRGSFGRKGIYGDARYDIAKLRHSACGFYDYILADMFELRETRGRISARIHTDDTAPAVAAALDQMIVEAGYDLNEIRFIEGLLFISMLPLHQGNLQRQQMMYLTGLSQLNEVLACSSS